MKALALLAASLLLGACSGAGSTAPASVDAPEPSTIETAAPPTATAEFSTDELIDPSASASPVQPSASPVGTWGPLAVLPPQDGMDTLAAGGTLRITDTCVYLEWPPGELTLLFWHADQVTWNQESRTITFENFPWNDDGKIVTVSDGDHVVIGGSGGGDEEGGESSEEFVSRMEWVAPPASSCPLDRWWGVGAVGD